MEKDKPTIKDLIWLFVLGCILGFILESIWYYVKHGVFINKQGLIYGPFKPIYGFGLDIIVLSMYKFKDKKGRVKFLIGFIMGSLFEYFSSLFQEYILGTSTWNYSSFRWNIGGRIYLPYCLAWGVIGIFCIDYLYPCFKDLASKCPKVMSNILTIGMVGFMVFNISVTTLATIRYKERAYGVERTNEVFKLVDKIYSDEYMKKKFPKLKIIRK